MVACTDDGGGDAADEVGESAGSDESSDGSSSGTDAGTTEDESGTGMDTTGTDETTEGETDTTTDTTTEGETETTEGETETTEGETETTEGETDTTEGETETTEGETETDTDGGETTGGIMDTDMDGVPDPDDPFPEDPDLPGTAEPNVVYAHTSSRLYTMSPFDYAIAEAGQFTFDQSSGSVTDIAIDRWGVLYAVTFNDLFVCDPGSAACIYLADLPSSFNGLTMVPPGTLDPDDDTLIGIANNGNWYQITVVGQQAQLNQIGQYGGGLTSAGDVFSIEGTGTFGSVNAPGANGNVIVESNPLDGSVIDQIAETTGYSSLWGLAGWAGVIFGFNSGGEVLEIDPDQGTVTVVADTPYSWWGAGVFTILPQ
ncbi:hypothetical protein PPSIR1_31348 [Plesiocystis pacifica SIR-1]|uniref:Uncharacterized protein n=1 Tax=Plesiocystis pacifica SIR-1 TaxID=391625 RepID=A6GDD2_9BACT|nr:hypothetical protein [Plesiocystis pacifica]EDM76123.1 hypothetical protein PPSIR1_31348 [Plesiocystis pacifica SIR-1]